MAKVAHAKAGTVAALPTACKTVPQALMDGDYGSLAAPAAFALSTAVSSPQRVHAICKLVYEMLDSSPGAAEALDGDFFDR